MNPIQQSNHDSIDRIIGSMVATMPIDFQLRYGKICTHTARMYGCGDISRGDIKRLPECWLCAYAPSTGPCQPPHLLDDPQSLCKLCMTELECAIKTDEKREEEMKHQREQRSEREINARKRVEREYERRARRAIRQKEEEMSRRR